MKKFATVFLTIIIVLILNAAESGVIFNIGSGNSVSYVDRFATFDQLNTYGIDLSTYTENELSITVNSISFVNEGWSPFDNDIETGFHYGNAGNYSIVSISTTDNINMLGVEFLFGSGWYEESFPDNYLHWETYKEGSLTGNGTIFLNKGIVVGLADIEGFDELLVGAYSIPNPVIGDRQSIALDNLNVQLYPHSNIIPEPSTILLFAVGFFGAFSKRRFF